MRRARRLLVLLMAFVVSLAGLSGLAPAAHADEVAVAGLRTNSFAEPLGVPVGDVRFGWQLESPARAVTQQAYQLEVSTVGAVVWDTGRVESGESTEVRYTGPALSPSTSYSWRVRIWDDSGTPSAWSEPASFETALATDDDWAGAEWIGADTQLSEWTDYTVTFTGSEIVGALGVFLRGRDGSNTYMWQISEASRALRPHVRVNGAWTVLTPTAFPAGFDFSAAHEYSFTVDGATITTSVDGTVVDTRTDSTFPGPGLAGFRTSGTERGTVDDVTVTTADGDVLAQTSFPDNDRTFTAGTVSDGALEVSGNTEAWVAVGNDVPVLRKEFTLGKSVESARIYATARGIYELRLNGQRVGDHQLAPGWTDYRTRIQYQTYDVTELLSTGDNAFGAELGRGWYSGNVGMFGGNNYGTQTSLIARLHVTFTDGTSQVVATDGSWRTTDGPITAADLLDGESYDARRANALGAWDEPGYDQSAWRGVAVRPRSAAALQAQVDPPVRVTQELEAESLPSPTPGAFVYDLGQNMVGHVRIAVSGRPGQTVRIRVAEVLNPDGSLYTANYRSAKATDYYTLATSEEETWEPKFTFHGFRYVEITGLDEAPPASAITGVVVGTDNELTGRLTTSSALVNQLQSNILWGQRGNFLSIPTDTPARDERLGWTGDINVFSNTANYNMDSQMFLTKWLTDLRDTQHANGAFPGIAPVVPGRFDGGYGSAGWADAGMHVPFSVWQAYGDQSVLEANYDAMKRFADYLLASSNNYIRNVGGYNDWLNLDDDTPATVIDTAFVAKSLGEFVRVAEQLGHDGDVATYAAHHAAVKTAFAEAFISADGTVRGDSQTAYILTIMNDLIPAGMEEQVAAQFVETLERRDFHLSTGFLGVDGLLPALTKIGRSDISYILLQNTDYPSWGYEIGKGATTIWERWNSIMPDGSFGPVSMNSFNHYAYGAVGEWMYRTMAGVSALEPGYRKVLVAPQPGDGITWVDYELDTPYGTVGSSWRFDDAGAIVMDVTIPANATAEVRVPTTSRWAVTEGGLPAASVSGIEFLGIADGAARFALGSGSYSFGIDEVLGQLGDTRELGQLFQQVSEALAAGTISQPEADLLTGYALQIIDKADKAWDSYLAGGDAKAAMFAQQALKAIQQAAESTDEAALLETLETARARISAGSATLAGASVSLTAEPDELFPGDTSTVTVRLANAGERDLQDSAARISAPAGWQVTQVTALPGTVKPGTQSVGTYRLVAPADAEPGLHDLSATVAYRLGATTVSLPVYAPVRVPAPVTVGDVTVSPDTANPGDEVTVTAELVNRSGTGRSGSLAVGSPGWEGATASYDVGPGATQVVTATLTVPWTVTAGGAVVTASVGDADGESGTGSVTVDIGTSPALYTDHMDLGLANSEAAHALTASQHSGTNVEAGLTRRYTHSSFPGGWFEFDVVVPEGQPFVLRAVETYDQAQRKTYDVSIDGVVVHQRRYQRTAGGVGTVIYQFEVDGATPGPDGTVRVRFQDVEADYDPSIADVWVLPLRTGLDSATNALTGSVVTAGSSLEAPPAWSRNNAVDGKRESLAGGAKGYTSQATSTAASVQWLAFDLGSEQRLDTVTLFPRTETADDRAGDGTSGAHFPKDFTIDVSPDGAAWTTVLTVTDQPHPGIRPQSFSFDAVAARHVRVHATELGQPTLEEGQLGFHRMQLAEVEAFLLGG
ncbi:family 78 glycoside hydrolase catalytic domain [Tessaracoccus sp. OS52]|uniref:family 78 glycoside hydrolase catalytic domain n=1 Tax=Tessaracoccus sp. OS52 TaxID=2886691 RepID=UPI001D0FA260|nr:family 78 glycoside hydrolase catalytic domain [Tessaracoccus sp. OS52]MCC2592005.1 family 78 glycoside hydrolase catalytic domain [Tessaracoccus sp. OS52]